MPKQQEPPNWTDRDIERISNVVYDIAQRHGWFEEMAQRDREQQAEAVATAG